jgi:hypothetical protein
MEVINMNLEEELSMIEDLTLTTPTGTETVTQTAPAVEPQVVAPAAATGAFAPAFTQPAPTMTAPMPQPAMVAPQPAPAMVNPASAQNMVSSFNMDSLDVDPMEKSGNNNPLVKLTGQVGEVFRLHVLPGAKHKQVKVHWDQEKGHNFCCLAQAYGTGSDSDVCCATHGRAKLRYVIPVVVIPSNRGQVQQGTPLQGELKALVVGGKTRDELIDQATNSGTTLDQADIIATVKDARYKTFNYAINQQSAIGLLTNLAELQAEWERNATSTNVVNLCGRLITREVYEGGYSNYDYNKYKTDYNNSGTNAAPQQYQYPQQPYQYPQQPYQQPYPQQYQQPYTQQPMPQDASNPWGL